ncbi:ribonuclease HII [Peptococcaceae bacterium SCADC1_2_3]|jgi:ribonuclease HII|nr:ribonuclease HII [Peptococcaceae bacterium SCADC1_2_3]KFI35920.1 ribonuclease HII [Peptococcaceae bacterium SCADC1_2_3]
MDRLYYERKIWEKGFHLVAGIDEAGRGSLIGAVVAAAVILPQNFIHPEIKDSKMLSAAKRELLYELIYQRALAVGVGMAELEIVERLNVKNAARQAMLEAVNNLVFKPDYLLVDAENIALNIPQENIIKGDVKSQSIAAASIIAKVTRDRLCLKWDTLYPEYGFKKNKGYLTRQHKEALLTYGPCPIHRPSFLRKLF